ncbi:hypothetical protein AB0F15_36635, partial [Amycolatopsis sp. NPDC026612]|uniref:hypothetical protein n=1 Tax=Amycolatopsis sp. NPDC026612 TaxID=3155466 RepID=UPI0033C672C8
MATELAEALTVPDLTAAFDAAHTQVVLGPQQPSELLGAVSVAAAAGKLVTARSSPVVLRGDGV